MLDESRRAGFWRAFRSEICQVADLRHQLPELTAATAKTFTIREVSADKAYTATANFEAVERIRGIL